MDIELERVDLEFDHDDPNWRVKVFAIVGPKGAVSVSILIPAGPPPPALNLAEAMAFLKGLPLPLEDVCQLMVHSRERRLDLPILSEDSGECSITGDSCFSAQGPRELAMTYMNLIACRGVECCYKALIDDYLELFEPPFDPRNN